ncbi:MAG: HEPN domain-containing protein [Candidatus Bathyarchaeia archaeon]
MVERSVDWLNQAYRDIKQAEASFRDGFYEWACFASQQAAEKAVKGLIQGFGGEAWGHSVAALIDALPERVRSPRLRDKALELDQAYITSRYPNAHPAEYPGRVFTAKMAKRLINYSKEIVRYCKKALKESKRG